MEDDSSNFLFSDALDSGQPVASTGKNDSTSIWGQLGSGLLTSTGSVLTTVLNNQTSQANAKNQAKIAAASSSSTITIVVLAVVALIGLVIVFAFLKRK